MEHNDLAHIVNVIGKGLPNGQAQAWPERFLRAAPVGADLSRVGWRFLLWLLRDSKIGAFDRPEVAEAVQRCAKVLEAPARGETVDADAAQEAGEGADYVAKIAADGMIDSAACAAWSAACAAWSAANGDLSADAVILAADSSGYAAGSVINSAAYIKAMRSAYVRMADNLIDELKA